MQIVILLFVLSNVDCFTNIFGELFNDLKFGSVEEKTIDPKLFSKKSTCVKGSFFINGSCYFISNKKSAQSSEILQNLIELFKEENQPQVIKEPNLDIPEKANFQNAKKFCKQLNKYSSLMSFDSYSEYQVLQKHILSLNTRKGLVNEEQYWTGITVKNKTAVNFKNEPVTNPQFLEMIGNVSLEENKCAYLSLKVNKEILIEWFNCDSPEFPFICKYVLDRCYNNTQCGKRGTCINLPNEQRFECRCRTFYEGPKCQTWSNQGIQVIMAVTMILSAIIFIFLNRINKRIEDKIVEDRQTQKETDEFYEKYIENNPGRKSVRYSFQMSEHNLLPFIVYLMKKKIKLIVLILISFVASVGLIVTISFIRHEVIETRIEMANGAKSKHHRFVNFLSTDICKLMNNQFFEDYILVIISLTLTVLIYVRNAVRISQDEELYSPPSHDSGMITLTLFKIRFEINLDFPIPMNPFSKRKRFLTGLIFAAYTYNILKIFESLITGQYSYESLDNVRRSNLSIVNNTSLLRYANVTQPPKEIERGILVQLVKQIMNVLIIGLRYYPILLCIDLKRKSKFSFLLCTCYVIFLLFYYTYMNTFCLFSSSSAIKKAFISINGSSPLNRTFGLKNFTNRFKRHVFIKNLMYEKFLFYTTLCLITLYMITQFISLLINWCKNRNEVESNQKVDNELKYTKDLFGYQKSISFIEHFISTYVYQNHKHFRFSKLFINTNLISFILLYYITFLIIRKSNHLISPSGNLLILMFNYLLKLSATPEISYMLPTNDELNRLITNLYEEIGFYSVIACCLTTLIYVVQLFLGIKSYKRHILNGYRGVYEDIPSPKKFSNALIAENSLHFSGYSIGYLLWGYLILFEVSLIVIISMKTLFQFNFLADNAIKILLPVSTIYILKRVVIWYLCSFILIDSTNSDHRFVLKSQKFYSVLSHFNFFFDCFIGSFVCLLRMFKSCVAALFFMPRLDYSIFGRFLEDKDAGFLSYVSFIHLEINQTHPIKITFCELLRQTDPMERSKRSKTLRNKWFVIYTLIKNQNLRRYRKWFLYRQSLVPKFETFDQFLRRHKNRIKFKRSKSLEP